MLRASFYTYAFWYEFILNNNRTDYNFVFDQTISGVIKIRQLKHAIRAMLSDYVLFNAHLKEINGTLYWEENKDIPEIEIIKSDDDSLANFVYKPFQLNQGPLCRFGITKLKDNKHRLIIIFHHVLIDGRFRREFCNTFSSYYNNEVITFTLSKKYISQLNQTLNKNVDALLKKNSKKFWDDYLNNFEPIMISESNSASKSHKHIQFRINKNHLKYKIELLGYTSTHNFFLNIWGVLIAKYNFENLSVVYYPIGIKDAGSFYYGAQINTIPYEISFTEHDNWISLLKKQNLFIQTMQIENGLKHSLLPNFHIKKIDYDNRFQTRFSQSQNKSKGSEFHFDQCQATINSQFHFNSYGANLGLEYEEYEDEFIFTINYCSTYSDEFIKNLQLGFVRLLDSCIQKPSELLKDISLLEAKIFNTVIYRWNKTEKCYPQKTLHELFEEQVLKTPDHTAILYKNTKISFKELDHRSDQVAGKIIRHQTGPYIGIFLNRSPETIIAILAILKAGHAYLPIDPKSPKSRVSGILSDSKTQLVITSKKLSILLKQINNDIHTYIIDLKKDLEKVNKVNFMSKISDLAYLLYTSGTTGTPKGIMVQHNNIVQLIFSNLIYEPKRYPLITNYIFDVSVYEIFNCLLTGGTLCLYEDLTNSNIHQYISWVKAMDIDCMYIPKFLLPYISNDYQNNTNAYHLKLISIGVEPIQRQFIEPFLKNNVIIQNGYGPTETSVCCISYLVKKTSQLDNGLNILPIGKPLKNVKAYILDIHHTPMPLGAEGELYIGGAGVTRGYYEQPELTKEKFISNPFQSTKDIKNQYTKLYKTGDIVKYLSDGNIEYLGRLDTQIKFNGIRFELEEIERNIETYPGITQAAVIFVKKNLKIVGYYSSTKEIDEANIKDYLYKKIPLPMVPSVFIHLPHFPMTASGKINRKSLPLPDFKRKVLTLPRSFIEKSLCKIYEKILGISPIGIHDDFFELGGQSILAIQASHEISLIIKKNVLVKDIFKHRTIANLIDSFSKTKTLQSIRKSKGFKQLSSSQKRFLFLNAYQIGTYNIPICIKFKKNESDKKIKSYLQKIVNKHEILRSIIRVTKKGESYILVCKEPLEIPTHIIKGDMWQLFCHKWSNTNFDLNTQYPVKACICRIENTPEHYLFLNFHHIAFDAWSAQILSHEFFEMCNHKALTPLSIQYYDYAAWENNLANKNQKKEALEVLINNLKGSEPIHIRRDKEYIKEEAAGKEYNISLPGKLIHNMLIFTKKYKTNLHSLLLSVCTMVFSKYTHQKDFILGMIVMNRNHPEVKDLIGCFINTVPLRVVIKSEEVFSEFNGRVEKSLVDLQDYQDISSVEILSALYAHSQMPRQPFPVLINFSYSKNVMNHHDFFETVDLNFVNKFAKSEFLFDFQINLEAKKIGIIIEYNATSYQKNTIKRMAKHIVHLMSQVINIDEPIKKYDILTKSEFNKLVYEWNKTERDYPSISLNTVFSESVKKYPHRVAVVFENQSLTFSKLEILSTQLAKYILQQSPPNIMIISLAPSIELIIAILAIFKAGLAYVFVDTHTPKERIKSILNDTKSHMLLTRSADITAGSTPFLISKTHDISLIAMDTVDYSQYDASPLRNKVLDSDLAYIIYTSGSTGLPKGVMANHKSVVNTIYSFKDFLSNLSDSEKLLQCHSYQSDAFCLLYAFSWLCGYEIHLLSTERAKDLFYLAQYIKGQQISYLDLPVVLYQSLRFIDLSMLCSIKYLIVGGDRLTQPLDNKYCNYHLINAYSPTEASINSHLKLYPSSENHKKINSANIGRSIENIKSYILDENLSPIPIGAIGELYIAGAGLAKGYLNNPKLTQASFLPNAFASSKDHQLGYTKIYKTGDLARFLSDGSIELLCRKDSQIKIRGFRIEPYEIEKRILQYSGINQCIVTSFIQNDQNNLVAYYVASKKINIEHLKKHLLDAVPDYMMPHAFVPLNALPLNSNGKIDKKALPKVEVYGQHKIPPNNEIERKLCDLWKQILKVDSIGINDDFFSMGGQSISAIETVYLINQQTPLKCSVRDLYKFKTIQGLCQHLYLEPYSGESYVRALCEPTNNKSKIFFIHPALSHSDVYQKLANKLNEKYDCYGVDNYHLLPFSRKGQVNTIQELAKVYLEDLIKIQNNNQIIFCGWSWGGQIALEMAIQLEKHSNYAIKLCLIDTVFHNNNKINPLLREQEKSKYRKIFTKAGMPLNAIMERLDLLDIVDNLTKNHLPKKLKKTEVTMIQCKKNKYHKIFCTDDKLKKFCNNKLNIIQINVDHHSVLNCIEKIADIFDDLS